MLRVALAGAGMVSRHHLIAWTKQADAQIVAIADRSAENRERRAGEFGIGRTFGSAEEMLEAVEIDALDIAAPMNTHGELIEIADKNGVPAVLCQKPLAGNLQDATRIAERLDGSPMRLMIHENWRFRPHYRRIAGWLNEGSIGAPRCFRMDAMSSALLSDGGQTPPGLTRQPFLADMERLLVLEVLVHHLDTLGFLMGPLDVRHACLTRISPLVRGEDTASIVLSTPELFGTLDASMSAYGNPVRPRDRLEIQGTEGQILLEKDRLTRFSGNAEESVAIDHEADYQASYDNTIAHFVQAIREETAFETPPDVHLRVLELVEAIYAAGTGWLRPG